MSDETPIIPVPKQPVKKTIAEKPVARKQEIVTEPALAPEPEVTEVDEPEPLTFTIDPAVLSADAYDEGYRQAVRDAESQVAHGTDGLMRWIATSKREPQTPA